MTNLPIKADYLVVTWLADDKAEAQEPHYYAMVAAGNEFRMRGYRGRIHDKVFFGRCDDRYMLQATGSRADEVLSAYDFREYTQCSFARVDLQLTTEVPNADHIILFTRPPKIYKALLTYNLNGPGATLYVGSEHSRARLRVYNKTAESDQRPDQNSDYIRIELQLRDLYADRAATYYYSNQVAAFFRTYIAKMADAFILDLVDRVIADTTVLPPLIEDCDEDWIARRYAWLENSVRPAVMKLALVDAEGVALYLKSMLDRLEGREL